MVKWENLHMLILEVTLPNERCGLSLHANDLYKAAQYKLLLNLLAQHLPR